MGGASELIKILQKNIDEYGDLRCYVEGNDCQAFSISDAVYDEKENEFRLCS